MSVMLRLSVPADARAPRAARAALRTVPGIGHGVRATATLLLSELVSNSVVHAGLAPDEEIGVTIEASVAGIRIEVADGGPGIGDRAPAPSPNGDGDGGRGLYLVELLATRWGVERSASARVWFELDAGAYT